MKRTFLACAALVLLCPPAWAGVVVEMEVTATDPSGKAEIETFYAEGENVRMDPRSTRGDKEMSVIFRDQTLWFLNHDKKVAQKIDKDGMEALSAQLDAVMKQLENVPPEQRAMMEKMMQGKMPGGMGEAPPQRVEVGGSEQVGEYPCTVHTLYSAEERVWEVCSADESVAEDVAEAMGAFRAMSKFTEELQDVMRQGPFANMIQTPYNEIDELGGFPVRVRQFNKKGEVTSETTLKSITRQDVDDAVFSIPKGYKVKNLQDEMKKGR